MAEEKNETPSMDKLIESMEDIGLTLKVSSDRDQRNRGLEILRNVKYIKSLPNDEDRAIFLNKNKDIRNVVETINRKFGREYPEIKKAFDAIGYPKMVKRNEEGLKTIDEDKLVSMSNANSAEDLFNPNSDRSWYKWKKEQIDAYAKQAGMTRGKFMERVAELDTQNQRYHLAHDGVGGVVKSIVTPRQQKAEEEGRDPTWSEIILDAAENAAQAVPVGKAPSVVKNAGKAYEAYKAASNTEKLAPGTVRLLIENGVVPTTFAAADAVRDGDYAQGANNALIGTVSNVTTPRYLRGAFSFLGGDKGGKIAKVIDKALDEGNIPMTYVTNKLGKRKYGTQGLFALSSLDPTGIVATQISDKQGPTEKETQHQKELEGKRVEGMDKEYLEQLIKTGVYERAMRRQYGDANVDLWLEKPAYAPDQLLFKQIKEAKEKGYEKL